MNQIKNLLKTRGIEDIRPTDEVLDSMGATINTWNKWIAGKKDPSISQLEMISRIIGCEVSELIPRKHEGASL